MINYNSLFEKSKELAKKSGLTQLELYQRFMFERILERISLSKYNNNFILKGGLLLSAIIQRDSLDYLKDYEIILDDIEQNDRMQSNWNSYRKKTKHAENIEFNSIIGILKKFIDNTR